MPDDLTPICEGCLVDLAKASKFLSVKSDDLRRWAEEKAIPCERVGGRLMFRICDLAWWVTEGRTRH